MSYLETFEDVDITMIAQGCDFADRNGKNPPRTSVVQSPPPEIERLIALTGQYVAPPNRWDWYILTSNLPTLISKLAPVHEKRLEGSSAHRYTGAFSIDLGDRAGLSIAFEDGRITEASALEDISRADARFATDTFLNLVFCERTYETLVSNHPDCTANREARTLFDCLFAPKPSVIHPMW